ncbi:MAG: AAA family ATPase [Cephaloticoccus sp.]|nr:AAA family ATPase [Cephaloticoccus sp.]MCF7760437.1 AAA family ATPase [Cephaloticoccus sp.]
MIAAVAFQRFKALRDTRIVLRPFNLIVGPNGSGKTSLIQALLQLRTLTRLKPGSAAVQSPDDGQGTSIEFQFVTPDEEISARLSCSEEVACDHIRFSPQGAAGMHQLERDIAGIRIFQLDHLAMAGPCAAQESLELAANGANISAVLAALQTGHGDAFARLQAELLRIMPEFAGLDFSRPTPDTIQLSLALRHGAGTVAADSLSQGTLYLLAILLLAHHPRPPTVICIEEIDRGIHPRMLRELRDLLYRLSYPESGADSSRAAVQVIATTHSPYLLDLFKDHPEEIIIAQKRGNAAHFDRLSDRDDLAELLAEGSLGDLWFSGILGGVPED